MNSLAAVSAVAALAATQAVRSDDIVGVVSEPSVRAKLAEPVALNDLTLVNPALESYFAAQALYDNRGVHDDATPRGVEIDRIEMIKTGFEHIRSMITKISDNIQNDGASEGAGVNVLM